MEHYDDILEFTPCFPELLQPCRECGESLYFISTEFPAACVNGDCGEYDHAAMKAA